MKIIVVVILLFTLNACYSPERNCKAFMTGTFKYEAFVDGKLETTIFIRNDSIQIEKYKERVDTSSIRWINDCEFILTPVNPKSILDKYQMHMKILSTSQSTYKFQFNEVGKTQKEEGIATKIEN